jgi:hypothetical protein
MERALGQNGEIVVSLRRHTRPPCGAGYPMVTIAPLGRFAAFPGSSKALPACRAAQDVILGVCLIPFDLRWIRGTALGDTGDATGGYLQRVDR